MLELNCFHLVLSLAALAMVAKINQLVPIETQSYTVLGTASLGGTATFLGR